MCLECDMNLEDNSYPISACWIKRVLNINIGNLEWHIFQIFNKTLTQK